MKFLRTVSTRRLLAIIAGLVVAIAAGTAIAVAASGSGPVPAKKPLARAIHDGLSAPAPNGISADITFTNHLIDSSNLQGSDPILSGASGRLWLSDRHHFRLELQSDHGQDAQLVVNGRSFWVYDPGANTVYRGTLPADQAKAAAARKQREKLPSVKQIQSEISRVAAHINLTGAMPGDTAGQASYTVRVSPKHDGGLLGAGELAFDAARGVPLRLSVYAQHQSSPVLELKATNISYGPVSSSVFDISPPAGAKTVKVAAPGTGMAAAARRASRHARHHAEVHGVSAVARRLPFKLLAPGRLVDLPRRSVTLLDFGSRHAALVTYGQNLGGIAVLEQSADKQRSSSSTAGSGDHAGLSLPTISVNGATGQELDTALGTMVRFTHAGVTYTVLGSVPPVAAEAAARAL